jgi:hypothetical protein
MPVQSLSYWYGVLSSEVVARNRWAVRNVGSSLRCHSMDSRALTVATSEGVNISAQERGARGRLSSFTACSRAFWSRQIVARK